MRSRDESLLLFIFAKITWPQLLRNARIAPVSMSAALKNPSDFISLSDEVWGIFVFSGEVDFSNSANLGTHFRRKHWGIQRGRSPWLRVSNRGEQRPVGTRLCPQSLVCYTFCDRGRLKGAVRRGNGHFEMTTGQANFADFPDIKCENLL